MAAALLSRRRQQQQRRRRQQQQQQQQQHWATHLHKCGVPLQISELRSKMNAWYKLQTENLSDLHRRRFLEVAGGGEDNTDIAQLVSFDGVGLDKLATVLDYEGVDPLEPIFVACFVRSTG